MLESALFASQKTTLVENVPSSMLELQLSTLSLMGTYGGQPVINRRVPDLAQAR